MSISFSKTVNKSFCQRLWFTHLAENSSLSAHRHRRVPWVVVGIIVVLSTVATVIDHVNLQFLHLSSLFWVLMLLLLICSCRICKYIERFFFCNHHENNIKFWFFSSSFFNDWRDHQNYTIMNFLHIVIVTR